MSAKSNIGSIAAIFTVALVAGAFAGSAWSWPPFELNENPWNTCDPSQDSGNDPLTECNAYDMGSIMGAFWPQYPVGTCADQGLANFYPSDSDSDGDGLSGRNDPDCYRLVQYPDPLGSVNPFPAAASVDGACHIRMWVHYFNQDGTDMSGFGAPYPEPYEQFLCGENAIGGAVEPNWNPIGY